MITMEWFFGEEHLEDVYALRQRVFMDEQGIAREDEFEGDDGACIHVVIYENDLPLSTGRVKITKEDYIIGRVATLPQHRGRGLATAVMQALIKAVCIMGGQRQILHAQLSAQPFYEKLGFTPYGEVFQEAGIPHICMEHFGSASMCCRGGE
ncbi:MAG: GNAT family N-acetyltransferase [Defluviitaleaceae bacterium]|nr:GNAT family N-acetyltransferase [Defluviitaleaceae bacterium]MCL2238741.1 GNAT family N-acetyltransferase [Defluviitaleaceae bacterium]